MDNAQQPELSAKQLELLALLLDGKRLTTAARELEIARSTATNWFNSKPFKQAYQDSAYDVVRAAKAKLSRDIDGAVNKLHDVVNGISTDSAHLQAVQVRAASATITAWEKIVHAYDDKEEMAELRKRIREQEDFSDE